jgi:hypothetical protein
MMTKSATTDRGGVDSEEIAQTLARVAALDAEDASARSRAMADLDANDDVRRAGLDAAHRARVIEGRTDEVRSLTRQRASLWGAGSGALVAVGFHVAGPVGGFVAGVAAFVASKCVPPDRALQRRVLR